jgi:SpoIIAA-like
MFGRRRAGRRKAMLKLIEGLPRDVLAIEATGKVTHEDYRDVLIPRAEAMIKGPSGMLYVLGKDFRGFELEALWDDAAFGMRHWHDFSHIAVVTDHAWIRAVVIMFRPLFHGRIWLFGSSELGAAKDWIVSANKVSA